MRTFYVIHSPYKDGSWRGMEKCYSDTEGTIATLFEDREAAERTLARMPEAGFLDVWPIEVEVPNVRSKKREDGVKIIETGDRWAVVKDGKFIGAVMESHDQWVFQSPDGRLWFPETGQLDTREAAMRRLLEEWG